MMAENLEPARSTDPYLIEQLRSIVIEQQRIAVAVATIAAGCAPHREAIVKLDQAINGNGNDGLKDRVTALEATKPAVDTLSVKAVITLLGAVGALAGAIAGAIGAVVAMTMGKVPPG
jgi:hypothetical protein